MTESETVTGFTWSRCSSRTPDTGLRPPDSGIRTPDCRTGSDTDTVAATATDMGAIGLVTGVPAVPFSGDYPMAGAATRRGMKMGWRRSRGTGAGDRDRDGGRDRVRDRDRIHLIATKQPDPGPRPPDSGPRTPDPGPVRTRTRSRTRTPIRTRAGSNPVTGVPTVPFSEDSTRAGPSEPEYAAEQEGRREISLASAGRRRDADAHVHQREDVHVGRHRVLHPEPRQDRDIRKRG